MYFDSELKFVKIDLSRLYKKLAFSDLQKEKFRLRKRHVK